MFLISEGGEFHNMGAAFGAANLVNDLSPVVAADCFSSGVPW